MNKIEQAFWQLFHAVDASIADDKLLDRLAEADGEGMVALALEAPPHAVSTLRREAERRNLDYPALIAALSEERSHELPAWWMAIARTHAVGVVSA